MGLWGGRFTESADEILRRLNDSLRYDKRMYAEDIMGSIAYAHALVGAGILTADEAEEVVSGLEQIRQEFDDSTFLEKPGDEDIHSAVERRLIEIVGDVGGKLHTGRSRNDQVATDFRLWTRKSVDQITALIRGVQNALVEQAETHPGTLMPGYTHFQPAQPITAGHWLMSFFWMLQRDRERLLQAHDRINVMPLGSGALAGTPLLIDRAKLADELGFYSHSHNSLDAVSDRDFVVEVLFAFSLTAVHLSRFAEDVIIYSNPALDFITLNDRYSTGSSLMPQKRNADPMELTRGKAGRLIGYLTGMLATIKGLPSGYNKDLQEDKETLFDAVDTMLDLLPVVTAIIETLQVNPDAMRAALSEDMLATDLADYLVNKGVPFRQAHHLVGQVVQSAEGQHISLSQVSLAELREISEHFGDDVHAVFDFESAVGRKRTPGGTAPEAVQEQITAARRLLNT